MEEPGYYCSGYSTLHMYCHKKHSDKPILHCDTKTTGIGASRLVTPPMRQFFITYTNMLVFKNDKTCVTPNAKPQRESVEYRLRWVSNAKCLHWPFRFYVVYPVFFTLGIQREPCTQWNTGYCLPLLQGFPRNIPKYDNNKL